MADLLREARKAARKGDYSRAGDLCDMAGYPQEAIQMYVQGRHFLLAGQTAARIGEIAAAAGYFAHGGDCIQAAELYMRAGQRRKAALMYERCGQYLRAAEVEEQIGNLIAAAGYYEIGGQEEKAAYLFAQLGNHLKAASLYEGLVAKNSRPDHASGAFSVEDTRKKSARYARFSGILHFKAGKFDKAAPRLEEAGLFEQAVEAYTKAGQTSRAAELLVRLEQFPEALKLVENDPNATIDGKIFAELLLRAGQFARAGEKFLEEGIVFKAAECFESAGDLERSAQLFSNEGEYIRAADLYAAIGQHKEAAEAYKSGNEHSNAAKAYVTAGLHSDAIKAYFTAGKPTAAAEILLERGQEGDAIRLLQQVKPGTRQYGRASFMLGRLFFQQGLYSLSLEKFDVSFKGSQNRAEQARSLYNLGLTYEQMGRTEEAGAAYQRVLGIDYHHADVAQRVKILAQRHSAQPAYQRAPQSTARTAAAGQTQNTSRQQHAASTELTPSASQNKAVLSSVSDRLDFVRPLGKGRHGEVLEAYDRALHRRVAVKKFPPSPGQPDLYGRLLQEAEVARQLIHPNVTTVFGTAEDTTGRYIIMEMVEGRTLRDLLDERVRIDTARALSFAQQAAEVLAHAHQNKILHRDLKPENIFIINEETLKISDFGIRARVSDKSEREGPQMCYASPEQVRGERTDVRSDIYSLGTILYEIFYGEPPFPVETAFFDHLNTPPTFPQKVDRVVPEFTRKVISKCLAKDPGRRYRSAGLLVDDFKASGIVPGVLVADRYEISRELGIGGMGRVYQAVDRDLDEVVAIKVLRVSDTDGTQVERFLREIKLARRIAHPNVVKVFDFGTWRENKYITMEFVDGLNLEQWRRLQSNVDLMAAARMLVDVARALHSAHMLGIIHRDIKPQNILIQANFIPKLLDFGIARGSGADKDLTTAGFVMGSPKYMSPEQIQAMPLDARTDIYSLGVVMYFVLTGREPFVGETPSGIAHRQLHGSPIPPQELNADLPEWLSKVVLKAMEKEAKNRFASMEELALAIEAGVAVPA
jgi:serine/threonine protein kinase/tetratricopeptide (TPR) repeat protein